jgi:fibronectin-binding autotransporter adhesin
MRRLHSQRTIRRLAPGLLILVFWPCLTAAPAATTTYTTAWSGGTIAAGDTVILDAGASITGNVVANGLLQFNQTTALTTGATISGTGGLSLTNTGTWFLTGLTSGTGRFDLAITASSGVLAIGTTGTNPLVVGDVGTGRLAVTGGVVRNGAGFLGFAAGSLGSATVSSGTWNNRGPFYVGGVVGGTGGTGTLQVTGGNVTSTTAYIGSNATASGSVTVSGGTWSTSANLNVGTSGTGTLTISGSGGTGGLVIVGGTLSKGAAGTITLDAGGTLQIGTGTTASGVLGTDLVNNGTLIFNRLGSGTAATSVSGTGGLTLAGSGTLRLTATSSYSGATLVNAGTLLVNGAVGSTVVSVAAGATLGGSGSIGGAVAVLAGGTLSPGDGLNSLACGPVSLLDGSVFRAEVRSAVPAADLLTIMGDLTLTGTVGLVLDDLAASAGTFAEGTILSLINYSGSWNGGFFHSGGAALTDGSLFSVGDHQWRIDYDAPLGGLDHTGDFLPDSRFVNVVAVPEPSAGGLLAIGLLGPGWAWRRPRRRGAKNGIFCGL